MRRSFSRVELVGEQSLQRKLGFLERQVFPVAAARAINRTGVSVRRGTIQDLSKVMGIKQKALAKRVVFPVRDKANPKKLVATITGSGKRLNAVRFGARQLKKGVSAKPWGRRQLFPGTWLMPSKKPDVDGEAVPMFVAKREGDTGTKRANKIRGLFGPGIAKEMTDQALERARARMVGDLLPKRLQAELKWRVERLAKGR